MSVDSVNWALSLIKVREEGSEKRPYCSTVPYMYCTVQYSTYTPKLHTRGIIIMLLLLNFHTKNMREITTKHNYRPNKYAEKSINS